ncbi:MAG TPA: saccharopine dehydrogenase NADP-binding domain-containing protein [Candidatus Nanoarchaeia archaeon]|nr:saccharopine dehydrogenase NADP-binding domain-containing protein [Candidatus Nanoarchaeia archaeon]
MKPNLLILGASGGLAHAVLHFLVHHRSLFNKLILLDKNKKVIHDQYLDHQSLKYKFIHRELKPERKLDFLALLKKHKINLVLDLTDAESIPLIEASNAAGVDYINTAINDEIKNDSELMQEIFSKRKGWNKARHILCSGMNPGNVNMWVRHGVEKFGKPQEVIHFEYDTSMSRKAKALVTWSIHEFLVEDVRDPGGIVLGRDKVKLLYPNALAHQVDMKPILSPILKLKQYPKGCLVLHEENMSIAHKYDIPSKFIYAFHPKTLETLMKIYKKEKNVHKKDLQSGDNLTSVLDGSDNIGVLLKYKNKKVYYFNSIANTSVIGTNATYTQVTVGVFAALFVLLFDRLKKGTYFVEDLYHTHHKYFVFDNLRVQEFVFNGNKLKKYTPEVKLQHKNGLGHLFI